VFALVHPAIEEVPQFRALILRVPLTKIIPVTEEPLLAPRLLLIAAATAETRIEFSVRDRIPQRPGLQRRAAGARSCFPHPPALP